MPRQSQQQTSYVVGMTHACHQAQLLLVKIGSGEHCAQASDLNPPEPVARIIAVRHCAWLR
jgi:hypothetical protein